MGKPVADIDFTMVKRLFEINELIFRIDQPERTVPSEMKSWRDVELDAVYEWPSCIEHIMKLVKDREFSDLCFDFAKKNDLMEIIKYLSSKVASIFMKYCCKG